MREQPDNARSAPRDGTRSACGSGARINACTGPAVPCRSALAVLLLAAALSGCSSRQPESSGLFTPYRTDLPQGNYVTKEMLGQIRPGMSREQVRSVLGAPLLMPAFRTDRWDYVFRLQHASGKVDSRRVTIRFRDDRVDAVEADELPEREDINDPALPGSRARPASS